MNTAAGREIAVPSTTVFMNFLKVQFDEMKTGLQNTLKTQQFLCITTDVWSSRAQSYLGMTVHFFDDKFDRESYVLALRELKAKQTYDVLTTEIIKVLNDFEIDVDQVTHIVTDGGSAFCKAFKVYGKSIDHLIERVDCRNDAEEEDVTPFIQYDDGEYFL